MDDWEFISLEISAKRYDDEYHIRKLNLKKGSYSYMTVWGHELDGIYMVRNVLEQQNKLRTRHHINEQDEG